MAILLWMFSALCPMDASWYFSGLIRRSVKLANFETWWSILILPLYVLVQWCLDKWAFVSYIKFLLLTLTNVRTIENKRQNCSSIYSSLYVLNSKGEEKKDFEMIGGRTSLLMCIIPTVLIRYGTIRQTVYIQHLIIVIQKATCFGCRRHLAFSITLKIGCIWRVRLVVTPLFVYACMRLSSVRTFSKYFSFATFQTALLSVFM
jgi:hypothetical protein